MSLHLRGATDHSAGRVTSVLGMLAILGASMLDPIRLIIGIGAGAAIRALPFALLIGVGVLELISFALGGWQQDPRIWTISLIAEIILVLIGHFVRFRDRPARDPVFERGHPKPPDE